MNRPSYDEVEVSVGLATFLSSVTFVTGHFRLSHETGIITCPAALLATLTPSSFSAVLKWYCLASPKETTRARTISPGRKHLCISTLSICWVEGGEDEAIMMMMVVVLRHHEGRGGLHTHFHLSNILLLDDPVT